MNVSGNHLSRVFEIAPNTTRADERAEHQRRFGLRVILQPISGPVSIYSSGTIPSSAPASGGNSFRWIWRFGIFIGSGPLTLTDSTVSGNHATDGGGIYKLRGQRCPDNSTVSGESCTSRWRGHLQARLAPSLWPTAPSPIHTADWDAKWSGNGGGIFAGGLNLGVTLNKHDRGGQLHRFWQRCQRHLFDCSSSVSVPNNVIGTGGSGVWVKWRQLVGACGCEARSIAEQNGRPHQDPCPAAGPAQP